MTELTDTAQVNPEIRETAVTTYRTKLKSYLSTRGSGEGKFADFDPLPQEPVPPDFERFAVEEFGAMPKRVILGENQGVLEASNKSVLLDFRSGYYYRSSRRLGGRLFLEREIDTNTMRGQKQELRVETVRALTDLLAFLRPKWQPLSPVEPRGPQRTAAGPQQGGQ